MPMPFHPDFKNLIFFPLFHLFISFSLMEILHQSLLLLVSRVFFYSACVSSSTSGFSPISHFLQAAVFEVVPP